MAMSIDEAIQHCEEMALCAKNGECGEEHRQLEEWLRELKRLRAEPVRHGRWVLGTVEPGYLTPGGNRPWICSECKQVISWSLGRPYENYCPNCGAKMSGGSE